MIEDTPGSRPRFAGVALLGFLAFFAIEVGMTSCLAQPLSDLRRSAGEALRSGRWPEAVQLYEEAVARNPYDGELVRALGLARLRAGRFDEAIEAYSASLETGSASAMNYYDIACAHALAGRIAEGVDALSRAYSAGFVNEHLVHTDPDLDRLREDPGFRTLVGWADPSRTGRSDRWTYDLAFLDRRIRELHWRPFAHISEEEFGKALRTLGSSVGSQEDLAIQAELQALLARIGDGHTAIVADSFLLHHGAAGPSVAFLPIELTSFDGDGVRVIAAPADLARLGGARLIRVDGEEVDTLLERLSRYVSRDNEWGARWGRMQALTDPKLLQVLGLGTVGDGFRFEFELLDGRTEQVLLVAGGVEAIHARKSFSELLERGPGWFEKDKSEPFLLGLLPKPDGKASSGPILYARIDGIRDGTSESFAAFTERLFVTASDAGAERLIVDLRDNLGGQGHLWRPLLQRLLCSKTFNRRGHLYVLVGRKTFSAAMALAAELEQNSEAIFVGEPTGSRPNFVGETSLVRLPYSELWVSISTRYHQNGRSNDTRFWIAPDLPAPPSLESLLEGSDPAIEAAIDDIRRQG